MARLYDRLMQRGAMLPARPYEECDMQTFRHMETSTVVDASNVARYYWSQEDRSSLRFTMFPNMAPPFSEMFVEFRVPGFMQKNQSWESLVTDGIFIDAFEIDSPSSLAGDLVADFLWPDKLGKPRWLLQCYLFQEIRAVPVVYGPSLMGSMALGEQGELLGIQTCALGWPRGQPPRNWDELQVGVWVDHFSPALLAVAFMHCKNVRQVENVPPPKLSRAYEKRHGRPLVKYYTLEIDPMKEVLRREGKSEEVGLKKALSICRGHFKDYTERGLFGKYKGLYWWDSHVRGHLSEGAVVKDYAVKAPRGG